MKTAEVQERLKRNIKIIRNEYCNLMELIQLDNEEEIYRSVAELLNWTINTDDLMYKNYNSYRNNKKKNERITKILLGLRHAFNSFKHNMGIPGVEASKLFPCIKTENWALQIKHVVWIDPNLVVPNKDDENAKRNFEAYKKYLKNKPVLSTFKEAIEFLEKESIEILKS